jgi:hypothetical protein
MALAGPMAATEPDAQDLGGMPPAHAGVSEVPQWTPNDAALLMLQSEGERSQGALLAHTWQPAAPVWLGGAAVVNLGDFPGLDKTAEQAENELRTLEWVIEEQRRKAAGQRAEQSLNDGLGADNWLRHLLPSQWIATLKEHREWVAAGGTALLVLAWIAAAFSRRAGSVPVNPPPTTEPVPLPSSRRRRRRHGTHRVA